jgi:hypothetical protein
MFYVRLEEHQENLRRESLAFSFLNLVVIIYGFINLSVTHCHNILKIRKFIFLKKQLIH